MATTIAKHAATEHSDIMRHILRERDMRSWSIFRRVSVITLSVSTLGRITLEKYLSSSSSHFRAETFRVFSMSLLLFIVGFMD